MIKKRLLALLVASLVMVSQTQLVYAEAISDGEEHVIKENIDDGLIVKGEDTVVDVYGDVSNANGDVGVYVSDGGCATVSGNVSDGVISTGTNSQVNVIGDITDKQLVGSDDTVAVYADEEGCVYVTGNVSANGAGVYANNGAMILVEGEVKSGEKADAMIAEEDGSIMSIGGFTGDAYASCGMILTRGDATGSLYAEDLGVIGIDGNVKGDVYADDSFIDITGDLKGDLSAWYESEVEIAGNVIGNVSTYSEGTEVDILGSVTGNIYTGNGSGLAVGDGVVGDVYSYDEGSMVYILGDTNGSLNASYGGLIGVIGNVNGQTLNDGDDSTIAIMGDVNSGKKTAIDIYAKGSTIVRGNVTSEGVGIKTDGDTEILITGTLTAGTNTDSDDPVIIVYAYEDMPATSAKIVVYEIAGNLDYLVESERVLYDENGKETDRIEDKDLEEDQIQNIFYIIRKAEDSEDLISGIEGTTTQLEYDTAVEDTVLTVTVKEGYNLKAGNIAVTRNADGTYTLIVPRGGGVTLSAEAIINAIEDLEEYYYEDRDDDSDDDDVSTVPLANNVVFTPVIKGNTISATLDPSKTEYSSQVVNMVVNAPKGGKVDITVSGIAYLDQSIVSALAARKDISMNLTLNISGVPYRIVIPAGFDLKSLMGTDGKISLAKLIETFGTKKIQA